MNKEQKYTQLKNLLPEEFLKPIYNLKTNSEQIINFYYMYKFEVMDAKGSSSNHQAWSGGYVDHIVDMYMIADSLWNSKSKRKIEVDFEFDDLILVITLHDLQKIFKVTEPSYAHLSFLDMMKFSHIQEFKFDLNEMHLNALKYSHGENEDYQKDMRVMNELAAYLHACDVISARGHHSYSFRNTPK